MKRAYRYRFYPTDEQRKSLSHTFGCVRFVYNWALRKKTDAYYKDGVRLYYKQLSALLTDLKEQPEFAWLNDVSSVPLQQSLRHLDKAFINFFEGRTQYPTFKKKRNQQSATYARSAFSYRDGNIILAKMTEPLSIVWSRPLPEGATPSSVTVSKDAADRYFISILVSTKIEQFPPVEQTVGADLGLKSFVALSTGEIVGNPKFFAKDEKRLARAQRRHTKKKRGSANRAKACLKVARVHARIADRRRDFLHKLSTRLIRENQTICVESLAVKNMVKNHHLAKAISDVGWGEFVRQLEYKAEWYGRTVVKIDRWYPSSKRCFDCGHILSSLSLDVREWTCPECGTHHDRDINASRNTLAAGLAVNVCGDRIRPSAVKTRLGNSR